jgi:hypothetical protein
VVAIARHFLGLLLRQRSKHVPYRPWPSYQRL